MSLMEFNQDRHFAAQDFRNDGHGNVVDGSDFVALELIDGRHLCAGNKNNRRPFEAGMSTNEPRYLKAVHARHVDVQQYGGKVLL